MRPEFLTACLNDILTIQEQLATYSPSAATRFTNSVFARVQQLETFPQLGRMVPELQQPTIRELLYGSTALSIGSSMTDVSRCLACAAACYHSI